MEVRTQKSPVIRPIKKCVVHRICAGQVILDLSSAVKELVENSLDAGATSVEIALKEYGLDSIQVIDNGAGITSQNFKSLALKHHTSKLLDFPDLQSLTTFGFRGEALSSLCTLGELTVETRTIDDVVATHLTFDHMGVLIAERKSARQVGTTVTVKKLFSNLPVRSKEFHRNIRKEYGKLISLLNAYAVIAKGVRIVCTNTTGRNARSVVLKTQGNGSLKENIIMVFGTSIFSCLQALTLNMSDSCMVEGFVSRPGYGSGRNIGDRQFFFVNGRPVDMPKVGKLVNELYRGANSRQYPIVIMNFSVPTVAYDVNVTPDKRKIFFSDETSILKSLRDALEKVYSSNEASYSVNRVDELNESEHGINVQFMHEGSQTPSKQLLPDSGMTPEEREDKLYPKSDGIPPTVTDNLREFSSEKMKLTSGGLPPRVHSNQKINLSETPGLQITDRIDKHTYLPSTLTKKGSSGSEKLLGRSSTVQISLNKFVTVSKRKHESVETALSEVPLLRSEPGAARLRLSSSSKRTPSPSSPGNFIDTDDSNNIDETKMIKISSTNSVFYESDDSILQPCGGRNRSVVRNDGDTSVLLACAEKKQNKASEKVQVRDLDDNSVLAASVSANSQRIPHDLLDACTPLQSSGPPTDAPVVCSGSKVGFTLQFSLEDLMSRRKKRLSRLKYISHTSGSIKLQGYIGSSCMGFDAATLELAEGVNEEGKAKALAAATSELERLFKKEDFKQMKVIGQFNRGFIIGKTAQDLFIVDQHAADEKYNYERLSQTTILNQQPLLRPLRMELAPEEEIVISMYMDIFRKNGFLLEEDDQAPCGHRFVLKAVPFSKNITFGVADIRDLISILSDSHGECSMIGSYRLDSADSVCPPRVRAMLASRACRSSVMIGDSLGRTEMQKILVHLASLKSPWNCPHGRPTMRHLVDLRSVRRRTDDEEMEL
ncbi:DNA mismatch repair protein PMS1-like isoform X2 [Salvia splendens]|uniref:DNA mismatch repair protein PMS1-like isoform X2 n=1 Tax=Salvia splendens TaxID=180675 RepID=UPI001C276B47|nr:DNA mismatch repair protein PMS1-like isoform X2 [Salvia splendens]